MPENYNLLMEQTIAALPEGARPTLLLHSCCGPCSSAVLERLLPHFAVTLFYYNPNIHPYEEYAKRLETQKKLAASLPGFPPTPVLEGPYDPDRWYDTIRGLEAEPEGGGRCAVCFLMRLTATAEAARAGGFDWFATTLSVSPHKNALLLNELGEAAAASVPGARYLPADFKKRDGYLRSIRLARELDLYRQDYCGCEYSMRTPLPPSDEGGVTAAP